MRLSVGDTGGGDSPTLGPGRGVKRAGGPAPCGGAYGAYSPSEGEGLVAGETGGHGQDGTR